jgi:hypothetical protein
MKVKKAEPEIIRLGQSGGNLKISRPMRVKPKEESFFKVQRNHEVEEQLQHFYKHKHRHDRLTELSELHDQEDYCFYEMLRTGSRLRLIPGYRLKSNWKTYKKAFIEPLDPRIRRRIYERMDYPAGHPNWVDVILPNGFMIQVQPRSSTPSYFKENKELEAFANKVRCNEL